MTKKPEFDPDRYLAGDGGFDPDEYLGLKKTPGLGQYTPRPSVWRRWVVGVGLQ